MYDYLLMLHNLFRWLVLFIAIYTLYTNFVGWKNAKTYTRRDKVMNSTFVGMLDLQLIIGLLLYFVFSPTTQLAFNDMKYAMHNPELRFYAVEHIAGMVIAIIVAHIGAAISKRSKSDTHKFRKAFIFFGIAILLILLSLPFTFHGGARPLNPFDHVGM